MIAQCNHKHRKHILSELHGILCVDCMETFIQLECDTFSKTIFLTAETVALPYRSVINSVEHHLCFH